jgi:probable rRNA maturation factor
MTLYAENETDEVFPFSFEELGKCVAEAVLRREKCPYEAQVNLVITDKESIREWNKQFRGIDRETDVLSFPNLEFVRPGEFVVPKEQEADCFDPDTGELLLGDIVICASKVKEQAKEYGHSVKREFAFLVAHSMLHLCGYDHMEGDEAQVMEGRQEEVLQELGIKREELSEGTK